MSFSLSAADVVRAKDVMNAQATPEHTLTVGSRQYSLEQLLSMPAWQAKLTTHWDASGVFRGVLLKDLLMDAGISEFSRLSLIANNDYKVALKSNQVGLDKAIVAYAIDGELLDPIDKGPYWIVWPEGVERLNAGEDAGDLWIWGLVNIRKAR